MESAITAIGTATPTYKLPQAEIALFISEALNAKPSVKRLIHAIYKATGIEYRYSVLGDYCKMLGEFDFFPNDRLASFPTTAARMKVYKDHALNLAIAAIQNCLEVAKGFDKKHITHLITVSCTGMYAPGIDIEIVQELQLASNTKRTCINFMGCYGAFNAIKVADAICKSDQHANVLIVCVELCSIHLQKDSQIENIISNAIFSDGAAAVLIQSNVGEKKHFRLDSFHCDLVPQTKQEMAWTISDSGFDIVLTSYVPEIINSGIKNFTTNLLKENHLTLANIDLYAIHPGGIKILEACENALNITKANNKYAYEVLRLYGNMSSATVLFVLKAIWDDLNPKLHDKRIFSCAFGPGLTLEAMILQTFCM